MIFQKYLFVEVNGKDIALDAEGYLVDPDDWNEAVASALAQSEGLTLDSQHWKVFSFMRFYYKTHKVIPDVRHTTKTMVETLGLSKKEAKSKLFTMFPYGHVKQACKISGMRRPRCWSRG